MLMLFVNFLLKSVNPIKLFVSETFSSASNHSVDSVAAQ